LPYETVSGSKIGTLALQNDQKSISRARAAAPWIKEEMGKSDGQQKKGAAEIAKALKRSPGARWQ
jgi:hypothetical protein